LPLIFSLSALFLRTFEPANPTSLVFSISPPTPPISFAKKRVLPPSCFLPPKGPWAKAPFFVGCTVSLMTVPPSPQSCFSREGLKFHCFFFSPTDCWEDTVPRVHLLQSFLPPLSQSSEQNLVFSHWRSCLCFGLWVHVSPSPQPPEARLTFPFSPGIAATFD